jgi:hypothetical protein
MTICHPEPVEGWIARSSRAMTEKEHKYILKSLDCKTMNLLMNTASAIRYSWSINKKA